MPIPPDPDTERALARTAFYGLDRLLTSQPPDEPLPAGEVAALVRLIRAARDRASNGQAANDR
jgi:hypothetical protein